MNGPPFTSANPPPGTVTVKGAGWRVSLPIAVLVAAATAVGVRLLSDEQRLQEADRWRAELGAKLDAVQKACQR